MDVTTELKRWLQEHWDPAMTVGQWWELLGAAGWSTPTWPLEWHGRALSPAAALDVRRTISEFGALGPPGGMGVQLAGPTIVVHGTDEQRARYLPDIVCGRSAWCQLFSEPGAGSDLAGLQARGTRDGDEWRFHGQKVWTSGGHLADLGILLARTASDVPKHRGITYFVLEMDQPGVDVRPLRELTGEAAFNEVFLDGARARDDARIGALGGGWAVANTTLTVEREGLGAGSSAGSESRALPGTKPGHLGLRAGDHVGGRTSQRDPATFSVDPQLMIDVARRYGKATSPVVRQALTRLYVEKELSRLIGLRQKALREVGQDLPGSENIAKLRTSELYRQARDLGLSLLGARGMLHTYGGAEAAEVSEAEDLLVTDLAMWSSGPPIYGGTDQIQRNILGERILGLPREPTHDRDTPFKDLPKNA